LSYKAFSTHRETYVLYIKLKFIAKVSKILWQKPQQLLWTGKRASRVNATISGNLTL